MNIKYIGVLIFIFVTSSLSIPAIAHTNQGLFQFQLPEDESEKSSSVQLIKYDPAIYELAYTTYLQTNSIKNAYALATAAVKQQPDSKIWRERLAQVAIWNNNSYTALKQYMYLVNHFNDKAAFVIGKKLAQTLHDDQDFITFLMIDIHRGNNTEQNWQDYVDTMLRLGDIQQMLVVLNKYRSKVSSSLYLLTQAKIEHLNSKPRAELKILNHYASTIKMTPEVAEQIAVIYLDQGKFQQAYDAMQLAEKNATSVDFQFWKALSTVAFLASKKDAEIYANRQLLKQKKPEIQTYTRLVEMTFDNEPELSYHYATAGKKVYPKSYPLNENRFALITRINHAQDFPKLYASTPSNIKAKLVYDNPFWNAKANYWLLLKNNLMVIQTYLKGISYLPQDDYLKADFISMLIELGDRAHLKIALSLWQDSLLNKPNLWAIYAQGYANIYNSTLSKLILTLFYDQFLNYQNNPYWLITFKDILENSFLPKQSAEVSRYAWPIFLNTLRRQTTAPDQIQLIDYVKLSMLQAAGDPTAVALTILEKYVNNDVALLMMTWALSHHNFSLAQALFGFYHARGIKLPPWVKLSIALHRNDRGAMRKILASKKTIVSSRDRIRAAQEIDAIPLAQSIAFEELKHNRKDRDLYDNFYTPLMLLTADSFTASQVYYQYGSVAGPREDVSFTHYFMPSISLTPYNSTWITTRVIGPVNNSSSNTGPNRNFALASVPPRDERAGMKIKTIQRKGYLEFDLAYRNNLSQFMTAKATRTYKVFNNLNTTLSLGYQQPADDTVTLLVGAAQNNIVFEFNQSVLAGDSLLGKFQQKFFNTQTGQRLASGSQFTLNFEHKFNRTYPDWTIIPYGVICGYYNKTSQLLTGPVLKLVPVGIKPNVNFFIPANFREVGITGSFGQSIIEDYTHTWRPFASVTISQNSVVGLGELVNFGLAGTVFGRDHLLLYYEWGSNTGQGIQTVNLLKLSYRIYL